MKKLLVIGIIGLFLGVAFAPSITSINIENIKQKNMAFQSVLDNKDNLELLKWRFPIICTLLYPIFIFLFFTWMFTRSATLQVLLGIVMGIGDLLNCRWRTTSNYLSINNEIRPISLFNELELGDISDCGCGEEIDGIESNSLRLWHFPVLCSILLPIGVFFQILGALLRIPEILEISGKIHDIGENLECWWA